MKQYVVLQEKKHLDCVACGIGHECSAFCREDDGIHAVITWMYPYRQKEQSALHYFSTYTCYLGERVVRVIKAFKATEAPLPPRELHSSKTHKRYSHEELLKKDLIPWVLICQIVE